MSACDENDPVPCKTKAQLDAEETPEKQAEEANERHPTVGWALLIGGALFVLGGIIRWCVAP